MKEWKEYKLGELIDLKNGVPFKSSEFINKGIPVIKIKNVKPNSILFDDLSYVSEESSLNKKCFWIRPTDILITMTGNRKDGGADSWVGKVALFKNQGKYLLNQRVSAIRVKDNNVVNYVYLAYLLSSWESQLYFVNHSNSSGGQANISPSIINDYEIVLPSLSTQQKIASILIAIDDKIENNRRINDNLEQQAQALYKQWFVDNCNEDWEEIRLSQIIDINKNSINPSLYPNTMFEHYSLPAYDDGILPVYEKGSDIKSSKFIINGNVILFSKLNPRIKRIWLPNPQTEHAICSTEFVPYQPQRSEMLGFCYSVINSDDFYDFVLSLTNGSTGSHQRFHPKDTLDYNFRVPKFEIIKEFEEKVLPLYKIISSNRIENQKLAHLRDTLLPKLMSGELGVDDVLVD